MRALVVNSPIPDLHAYMLGFVGSAAMAEKLPPLPLSAVDDIPDSEMPRTSKLSFKASCRRFGVDSIQGWFAALTGFTAVADLGRITCPSLAMVGTGEGKESMAQFETFCNAVSRPVTRRIFTVEEGADMHCQIGNLLLSNAVIYDWLLDVL